jgi:signal transduction histidine kinase
MTNLLKDPNVGAVVLNYRDITERKKLEEQKDDFVGIASHELKTPITSIKAYTQLLQYRFRNAQDSKSVELVNKMDAQLDKLTSLINDLLDVTKIEGRKIRFNEEYFDLNELINETVEELQRTSLQHTLVTKLTATKSVYGDRNRIGQVLTNLITNAIKYSPRAKEAIVKTRVENTYVTICVQDFGIGIAEKEQLKVFERFFRVGDKGQETFPGLGLGLYISAEIVRRHSGKLWVESKKGKGSTFCFRLPIEKKKFDKKPIIDDPIKKGMYHEGK